MRHAPTLWSTLPTDPSPEDPIPIGKVGRITNCGRKSHFVRVEDDQVNTGGFLVYEWWDSSDGPNSDGAFDDWVEKAEHLASYFRESNWHIDWES